MSRVHKLAIAESARAGYCVWILIAKDVVTTEMNANQSRYKGKFCKSNVVRWKNKVIKSNKTRHNLPKPIGKYQYSANLTSNTVSFAYVLVQSNMK